MIKKVVFTVFSLWQILGQVKGQIVSGPMVGDVQAQEVVIWLQTEKSVPVQIVYFPTKSPTHVKKSEIIWSQPVLPNVSTFKTFIAKIRIPTEPETEYAYEVWINKKKVSRNYPMTFKTQSFWHYRKEPRDFKIGLGSCLFIADSAFDRPGEPYGSEYEILDALYQQKPDVMLWLGDNTYYREPDFFTVSRMIYRYTHTRSLHLLQPLFANSANYAIWDDHDYGPNDADRSFPLKNYALDIFNNFWTNPLPASKNSFFTSFYYEDCEIFLLDNRFFRTPNRWKGNDKTILGEEQKQWLMDALTSSKATFKLVCIGGQVLNTAAVFENYATFEPERTQLIETIQKHNITNVIFLTGDRHHSELTITPSKPLIYDLTVSPLTSKAANYPDEKNEWRVPNSYIGVRNFAILNISGPRKNRKMDILFYDKQGKVLWNYTIHAIGKN